MSNSDLVAFTGQGAAVWALVAAVFTLAGTVKGVIGLGLPTLSMALLAVWMPPAAAAALLIVPSLVTNVWQLQPWGTLSRITRRLAGMQTGIVAGTLMGAWCFGAPAGAGATMALGVSLVCYAAWGLLARPLKVPASHECWLGPLAGVLTGGITAVTGVFVLPAVVYLQSLELSRDELIQAMGLSFTTSTVALGLALAGQGGYSAPLLGVSLAMLVPAIAGMALGQWVRMRLPVPVFKRCFFTGLALLGIYMVLREIHR
ncbi:sulfite exporter TauE/SafE family protein [Variovorax sp. J2P1-59]|uniref:sulfite exporter TauE/SafE family protein n=1 Tax=Variovorax flavidus TaxID=3053501 RepID=UPI0025768D1B|nr:sulfite exporter TauE/SafE family protein [Variovorax sp. J2P1-59]MDM0073199.1 sulfite exporter TauE/SafE family protein [Variovorax sp. J2P1-59]